MDWKERKYRNKRTGKRKAGKEGTKDKADTQATVSTEKKKTQKPEKCCSFRQETVLEKEKKQL